MKWYYLIPICLCIIGYFGIFWTMSLSDMEFKIEMDNNTLQSVKELRATANEIRKSQMPLVTRDWDKPYDCKAAYNNAVNLWSECNDLVIQYWEFEEEDIFNEEGRCTRSDGTLVCCSAKGGCWRKLE